MLPGIHPPLVGLTSQAIEATLSAGSTGLDLSTLFTGPDWASSITKRVILPPGVTRGSNVRTTAALRSGTGRGGLLEIVVNGTVEGCGAPATTTLVAGLDGGDCILAEQSGVTVLGSGTIRSGGGAGGKGGNGSSTITEGPTVAYGYRWRVSIYSDPDIVEWNQAAWYIARGNTSYSTGGWTYYRGSFYGTDPSYTVYYISRQQATATTSGVAGRGQGHDGAKSNGVAGGANSGLSGNGGDWGSSGVAGAAGTAGSGTAAGLAGFALKNIANITNLFTGTLQGRTG